MKAKTDPPIALNINITISHFSSVFLFFFDSSVFTWLADDKTFWYEWSKALLGKSVIVDILDDSGIAWFIFKLGAGTGFIIGFTNVGITGVGVIAGGVLGISVGISSSSWTSIFLTLGY